MKTARVSVTLAILLSWAITSPLFAQGPPGQTSDGSDAPDTYDFFGPRNVMLRSDIGDGVGYSKGFQTFSAFQSMVVQPEELIFFVNPRGIITYLGNVAANVGAGGRWYDEETDRIWGASVWYDHDNTSQRKYDQMGFSLESLGKYLDFRVNGYFPTNDDRDVLNQYYNGQNAFFSNFIGLGRSTLFSTPLKGGDFEVGGLLPGIGNIGIRPYVGGYYYQGEGTGAAYGVRARVEALITQDFWAQVAVTNDRLFGTNVTGALTWYYGSGQKARWFQRIPVKDRLYQQVERQYRIAVYEELYNDFVTALRAGGTGGSGGPVGTPIYVVHVDNSASAGGDGTVEHPLNQLPTHTGSNVDIVFVNRGTGTSAGYNHGITLNDYQRLLGQGVQHEFNSLQGTYQLPGYSAGSLPVLTNGAGNVVTLASHNEVSGFNLRDAGSNGIYGNGITDFNINNVRIRDTGAAGIGLVNATGNGQIFDVSANNNGGAGLAIANTGGDLQLRVDRLDAGSNQYGVHLTGTGSANFNVIMRHVNASDNTRNGVDIALDTSSSIVGTFDHLTANNNNRNGGEAGYGDGIRVRADNSVADLTVQHSTFDGNQLNGASFIGANGADMDISLLHNRSSFDGNQLNGVLFTASDSDVNFNLIDNRINENNGFGVSVDSTNGVFNLVAYDNTIRANRGAGISYALHEAAQGTIDIQGNEIVRTLSATGSQDSSIYVGQAIDIRLAGSTNLVPASSFLSHGVVDHNVLGDLTDPTLGNAGGGIWFFAAENTAMQNVTVNNNTVGYNGGDGVRFVRRDSAIVNNVTIADNAIQHNNGDGVRIEARGSPNDVSDYTVAANSITDNAGRGIGLFVEADAGISADILGNTIVNNGNVGIDATEHVNTATDLRVITGTWQRNTITNNNGDGIRLAAATNSLLIGSLVSSADGNLISNNTQNGIEISGAGSVAIGHNEIARNGARGVWVHGTSFNTVDLTGNYIHHNTGDGIGILNERVFGLTLTASLNTIQNNGGRGVNILNRVGSGTSGTTASITLNQNLISGNRFEGVYVVNTASSTQSIDAAATDALASDGSVTTTPRMFFTMTNNIVQGNGSGSGFSATGLVLRVGTSDGGYGFANDGGFFGEGNGGVGATISGNTFAGNLGDDVYFASFKSTVDPVTTAGTWNATDFQITAFEGDPLARLDLTFTNNNFDSADLNNIGAFYNNADGLGKSRTIGSTDSGPFVSDTRERNAQRLAARFGLPPATPGGASNSFLYSGLGQSTFRLLSNPTGNVGIGSSFDTDAFYVSPASANGPSNPGPGLDTMPYGWNLLGGNPRPQ